MRKIYIYKLTSDDGGAPCVHDGVLSLAICKPRIRSVAKEGTIILGFAADLLCKMDPRYKDNCLIYDSSRGQIQRVDFVPANVIYDQRRAVRGEAAVGADEPERTTISFEAEDAFNSQVRHVRAVKRRIGAQRVEINVLAVTAPHLEVNFQSGELLPSCRATVVHLEAQPIGRDGDEIPPIGRPLRTEKSLRAGYGDHFMCAQVRRFDSEHLTGLRMGVARRIIEGNMLAVGRPTGADLHYILWVYFSQPAAIGVHHHNVPRLTGRERREGQLRSVGRPIHHSRLHGRERQLKLVGAVHALAPKDAVLKRGVGQPLAVATEGHPIRLDSFKKRGELARFGVVLH